MSKLQRYRDFSPTGFDKHITVEKIEDWYMVAGRKNGSSALENFNFKEATNRLNGEGKNVEIHRFDHWACGWFEILLVRPDTPEQKFAEEVREELEEYPLLDDDKYNEFICEQVSEYIENMQDWEKDNYIFDYDLENHEKIWEHLFDNWE